MAARQLHASLSLPVQETSTFSSVRLFAGSLLRTVIPGSDRAQSSDNGSAASQNLVIGGGLWPLFHPFFFPRLQLTELQRRSEVRAALGDVFESVSNLELPARPQITSFTLFSADLSHPAPEEQTQTETGRVGWCLFVNLTGFAASTPLLIS